MPAVLFLKPPESELLFQLVPNLSKLLILVVDVTCGLKKVTPWRQQPSPAGLGDKADAKPDHELLTKEMTNQSAHWLTKEVKDGGSTCVIIRPLTCFITSSRDWVISSSQPVAKVASDPAHKVVSEFASAETLMPALIT